MVGKPNLPERANERCDIQGAAMVHAELSGLDQEREASMADEGGASGAMMESQEQDWPALYNRSQPLPSVLQTQVFWTVGLFSLGLALGYVYRKQLNRIFAHS